MSERMRVSFGGRRVQREALLVCVCIVVIAVATVLPPDIGAAGGKCQDNPTDLYVYGEDEMCAGSWATFTADGGYDVDAENGECVSNWDTPYTWECLAGPMFEYMHEEGSSPYGVLDRNCDWMVDYDAPAGTAWIRVEREEVDICPELTLPEEFEVTIVRPTLVQYTGRVHIDVGSGYSEQLGALFDDATEYVFLQDEDGIFTNDDQHCCKGVEVTMGAVFGNEGEGDMVDDDIDELFSDMRDENNGWNVSFVKSMKMDGDTIAGKVDEIGDPYIMLPYTSGYVTAAHEYGHTRGLYHPDSPESGEYSEYRWDPQPHSSNFMLKAPTGGYVHRSGVGLREQCNPL